MPMLHKFLWGLLAGLAVVCVKIIGPDVEHVQSLFIAGTIAAIAFYAFISLITIVLGGISGLFSKDNEPARLLIFCASFPALISTALAPQRVAQDVPTDLAYVSQGYEADAPSEVATSLRLVGAAHAQNPDDGSPEGHICDEGGFGEQFLKAARDYISPTDAASYVVIIASTTDFDEAVAITDRVGDEVELPVGVGCRRPGNEFYPVIVGKTGSLAEASETLGFVEAQDWVMDPPYLSNYPHRVVIYPPSS